MSQTNRPWRMHPEAVEQTLAWRRANVERAVQKPVDNKFFVYEEDESYDGVNDPDFNVFDTLEDALGYMSDREEDMKDNHTDADPVFRLFRGVEIEVERKKYYQVVES